MIVIISGTNRPGSNTRKVTTQVEAVYKSLGVKTLLLDLAELPSEIFCPTSYAEKPAAFKKFTDAILASDGLVIVTPEYNGSVPGVTMTKPSEARIASVNFLKAAGFSA